MADRIRDRLEWFQRRLQNHAAGQVVYQLGGLEVEVPATIGRTLLKVSDGQGGFQMHWTDRDFLIAAVHLVLAGVGVEPTRGAQIREAVGGQVELYEVLAPGQEPVWRWSDPHRTIYRIHTKLVGKEF
ncbi:MAG: hypothetical protein H0U85_01830 [Gemmatimonadales bacterium]|nr:hypothetical protein [Gemmatimonadales bacterium]